MEVLSAAAERREETGVFVPTGDYRMLFIEMEARRLAGIPWAEGWRTYPELAALLTRQAGWTVDAVALRHNFARYARTKQLAADISRRRAMLGEAATAI